MVLGTFLHTVLHAGIQSHQSGRTKEPCWPDQGPSNGAVILRGFRQNSEAVGLSQVSKIKRQLFLLLR